MESKIELTDRLRGEGRWGEASEYRDTVRAKLRSEGMPQAEAREKAWLAMAEKYPPNEEFAPQTHELPEGTDLESSSNPLEWGRHVVWVYENIERTEISRPPGIGAVSLLKWARSHQEKFYDSVLPKAVAVFDKQTATQGKFVDDHRKIFTALENFEASLLEKENDRLGTFSRQLAEQLTPRIVSAFEVSKNLGNFQSFLSMAISEVVKCDPSFAPHIK